MEQLETKIKNLTFVTILGFVLIGVLLIGLYFKGGTTKSVTTGTNTNTTTLSNEQEYDKVAANFEKINVNEALGLYDKEGTHVIYIGRNDCGICQQFVPILKDVQDELNFKINYIDLNEYNNFKTSFKDLAAKFTVKAKANDEEDTIGNLFIKNGYTPTVIIIKDGKTVDGFIGYRNVDTLKELIKKYL